jgi:hypothetical protein
MKAKWKHWNGQAKRWISSSGKMIEKVVCTPAPPFYSVFESQDDFMAGIYKQSGQNLKEAKQIAEAMA